MDQRRSIPLVVILCAGLAISGSASDAGDRSFLWRATDGQRTVYLLGSIHFMQEDAYPLSTAIENAYAKSGVVAFETDIDGLDRAALALLTAAALDGDTELGEVIPDELYRQVSERLEALDMSPDAFDGMKPWMVALSLTSLELMRAGYLGSEGVDATFNARAKADGKSRRSFESIEYQVSLFADLTDAEGIDFLRFSLAELDTAIPLVDELVGAWSHGDVERMATLLVHGFEEHPDLYRRLVVARNHRWISQIEALFRGEADALVVVGALHLVGEQGLIELLKARGYEVEQL